MLRSVRWEMGLSAAGAVTGGAIGFLLFRWIASQGLYAPFLLGALIGLGAAVPAGGRADLRGVLCAALAIAAELFAEGTTFPFVQDESLAYFFGHLGDLPPIKFLLMGLGGALAFWIGRDGFRSARESPPQAG